MKTHSVSLIVSIGILAAVIASCSRREDATLDPDTVTIGKVDVEKAYTLQKSKADFGYDDDLTFGYKAEILMPQNILGTAPTALRDSILMASTGTTGNDAGAVLTEYFAKAVQEHGYEVADTVFGPTEDDPRADKFLNRVDGFESINGTIMAITPNVLCYSLMCSSMQPGAAHGMYGTRYFNYDIAGKRVLALSDLFTPSGIEALPAIIAAKARRMAPTIGPTDIKALPADDNFYLPGDGTIVFAYRPYEVASYAQGEINIPLEAYSLSDFFTPAAFAIFFGTED